MNVSTLARRAALALALAAAIPAAMAGTDRYAELFEMQQMDRDRDGMVAKDEFLAMVAKLWDMRAAESKLKGDRMNPEQIKSLEAILGRTLSAHAGS